MANEARMDPELKAKWVAALRSGEYQQTTGQLRKRDGYCCLGVLCAAIAADYDPGNGFLPMKFADEAGISGKVESSLIEMNDTQRKTFPEIADWIEENL
jgi:hypothetical protein